MEATVAKLKKNTSSEVWVCLRDYQNRQYVDVREHFLLGDDRQWHPTKKGIMISPALLPQVIDGMEALDGVTEVKTVATIPKSDRDENPGRGSRIRGQPLRRNPDLVLGRRRGEETGEGRYVQTGHDR